MKDRRFDALARSFSRVASRRHVLRGLAGAGLGLAAAWPPPSGEARKRRKRKQHKKRKPKATPNEFGCFEVGDPCASEADCCSGICEGKKCRAHGTGSCPQDSVGICLATADDVPVLKCGNNDLCFCYTTTAGSNFCGHRGPRIGDQAPCADCQTDADCTALGFPAGSACAPVGAGYCSGQCPTGMACLPPCGTELPPLALQRGVGGRHRLAVRGRRLMTLGDTHPSDAGR